MTIAEIPHIPNGCYTTPRNWVKFGQFLLQKGSWNGKQIINKNRMEDLFIPKNNNPACGVFLWLNNKGGIPPTGVSPAPEGSDAGFMYYSGMFYYENPATVPNPAPQSLTRIVMPEKHSHYFPPLFFKSFRQF